MVRLCTPEWNIPAPVSIYIYPSTYLRTKHVTVSYTHFLYYQTDGFEVAARNFLGSSPTVLNADHSNLAGFLKFNLTAFSTATGLADPIAGTFFMTGPSDLPEHTATGQQIALEAAGLVPSVVPSFEPLGILDVVYARVNNSNFLARTGENLTVAST
jgi:hypothetical protein